ncbi:hypothetical protein ONS95_011189 [Cadophora gregata]|uniref:uncharacterized protein n=1 Tax=Cadophora gregata TaxID=51156 RepID=UPI0026DDBAF9|nr:uncharacterized protein ONS95_011189 [Cadophora gregata]KAK0119755.1 hypothetical protein ONS95_011189 [Cadophora gregata]
MAQSRRRPPPFYDFSPFQHAPGVAAQIRKYGAPQIVDIPQTTIPSPLAPCLAPDTVAGLKRRLLGDGSGKAVFREESAGAEVWASWKRAWDLWNNHYIEGRVSPVWIREEYERLKKEMEDARDKRRREQEIDRFRNRNFPKRHSKPTARATVFSREKPEAAPGKVYKQTSEIRPAKNAIVKKLQSRPKPGSKRVFKRKGEKVPVYGERVLTEIVQVERVVPRDPATMSNRSNIAANNRVKLPVPKGNAGPKSLDTVIEIALEERQVMEFGHVDVSEEKISPNAMSSADMPKYRKENNTLPGTDETPDETPRFGSQRPQMWHPVTEPCLEGERTLTVDETVPIIEFEDRWVDVLEEDGKAVLIGWVEEDEDAVMEDVGNDSENIDLDLDLDVDDNGHLARMPIPVIDEEPAVFYKPRHLVERDDHFSGGFFPMKSLDPYPEPDDSDDNGNRDWLDALQNTVWRPRHVGEKTLQIEMDDLFDETPAKTWLEVDGGVDCGRSPYPVLRSVTEYVKIPKDLGGGLNGVFRKKKMWDGVTGTIFNMPTKPLEQDETEDERMSRMHLLYGDFFRDNRYKHRHDFFPLDIRRVKRRSDRNYPGRQTTTPMLENRETLVRYPWHIPEDEGKDLPANDPWAVTAEQKRKKNVPVRRHPPAHCYQDKNQLPLLPVDDLMWREELQDDDYGRWKYFVTNLHGGTLLINGQEIKKNQIAGPLPEFAVIECPGKQIAFWWGPGGRNYLQGQPGYDHESRWESLRRSDPDLAKVALTSGQEWDYKIRVRITKEFSGNEWEDDAQWDEWKKAVAAPSEPDLNCDAAKPALTDNTLIRFKKFNKLGMPTGTDIIQPECFPSDRDELRWLHTKAEPLSEVIQSSQKDNFIDPLQVGMPFFPGSIAPEDVKEVRAQRMAKRAYNAKEREIIKEQMNLNVAVAKMKTARLEREREASIAVGMKREAESQLQGPFPKKNALANTRGEAEEDLKRYDGADTEPERYKMPQNMEFLVRVFDKDVRSALERNIKEYGKRKTVALAAGRRFTEILPTLDVEIEQYLDKRREREQDDLGSLEIFRRNRLAAGIPMPPETYIPPGVDEIYAAWKADQAELAREAEEEETIERQAEELRLKINQAAEQERLRKAKAAEEAALKRFEMQQTIADQKAAAEVKMTLAEIAQQKRLASWRAILANNKAKKALESKMAKMNAEDMPLELDGSELHGAFEFEQQPEDYIDTGKSAYSTGSLKSFDGQAEMLVDDQGRFGWDVDGEVEGNKPTERRRIRQVEGEAEDFEMAAEELERRGPVKVDVYRETVRRRAGDNVEVGLTL